MGVSVLAATTTIARMREDLFPQWAAQGGHRVVRIESEIDFGMNGGRAKAKRLLADPDVTTVVVEHKDRLGRMNVELIEAALSATGRRLVVLEDGEVEEDLVRDMAEALTSFCARRYGRRSATKRAKAALEAAAAGDRAQQTTAHHRRVVRRCGPVGCVDTRPPHESGLWLTFGGNGTCASS